MSDESKREGMEALRKENFLLKQQLARAEERLTQPSSSASK